MKKWRKSSNLRRKFAI